jgi:hypothetical protein
MQMVNKENVVLYLDKEIVEKSKELGFNLSKTFENHLKYLMTQLSIGNSINNFELCENKMNMVGLPVPEPETDRVKTRSWKLSALLTSTLVWHLVAYLSCLFLGLHKSY